MRRLIVVTDKNTYPLWRSAEGFALLDTKSSQVKYKTVQGGDALLLAEAESNARRDSEREVEVRAKTTGWVLALINPEKARKAGARPLEPGAEVYVAAHALTVDWRALETDETSARLIKAACDFPHDKTTPIYPALLSFVVAPDEKTFGAVVEAITNSEAVKPDLNATLAAFCRLKHRLVRTLKQVDLRLQGWKLSGFDRKNRKIIAERYQTEAGTILERLRTGVYNSAESLHSALQEVERNVSGPNGEAVAAAWQKFESLLPREGKVTYSAGGVSVDIGDMLAKLGDEEGLKKIRDGGWAEVFCKWYHALDAALDDVRAAVGAGD